VFRFLASFALTLLVALPSTAFASALNLCAMTPNVIRICHCQESTSHWNRPALERADCCASQSTRAREATSSDAMAKLHVPAAAVIARVAIAEVQSPAAVTAPKITARSRAPPLGGTKTYLRDCRILS
jgi:hypothetical protein